MQAYGLLLELCRLKIISELERCLRTEAVELSGQERGGAAFAVDRLRMAMDLRKLVRTCGAQRWTAQVRLPATSLA